MMTFGRPILPFLVVACTIALAGCSYLGSAMKQANYASQQAHAPTQRVYKHLLETDNFFVYGKIEKEVPLNRDAVAVVAISDRFRRGEVVDISHFSRVGSYYGLNLPAGEYQILVVSDLNRDGFYDQSEIVGGRPLSLDRNPAAGKVVGDVDIPLQIPFASYSGGPFRSAVHTSGALAGSLFYPKGSIRALDDDIFSPRMSNLGLYEPAAFLEEAPMMFYALEEDVGYKVPVVFVHGINGSPRDFEEILSKMDRTLHRPWFFYYPGGNSLSQQSEMFYSIFLSGKVMALQDMPMVIVAHSMGGLVVRDALNRLRGDQGETRVQRLITIASPMQGHPDASSGAKAPVVIPSWRDLAPESSFVHALRRKSLPASADYHLLYAYGNSRSIKLGENSDGVVPLSSQICSEAQAEATAQYGFNATHMGILKNQQAVQRVVNLINEVRPPFPEEHLKELLKGGYPLPAGAEFSPVEGYLIRTVGHWMEALATGAIAPIHPDQADFLRACRGEKSPGNDAESAWIKFTKEYSLRKPE
jgi:pimeloyl-ACP methyl ester carboxylesterase